MEDRAWLARFRREAKIAAGLQHPNLVSVYDFEAEGERPYLVMAHLSGGSLEERLDNGGAPDPERIAADLLRALGHIHAAGIVHRDVKPGNVLLAGDGRACLTDFGVARPQDATAITQTGQIPGTARYMAPELWRGEPADERSDLFACGVLLSQCLRDDSPVRLVGLTDRLSAEHPELRPASAEAALEMLGVEESEPATVLERAAPPPIAADPELPTRETPPDEPSRARAPRWLPIAALCAVALVAGIVFVNAIGGDDDPQTQAERDGTAGDAKDKPDEGAAPTAPDQDAQPPEPTVDGVELNNQGKALIDRGAYDNAIPVLEQAVAALEGTDDITYAYALFNLGNAYRLAGRPADAIPILEQRLEIPNQTAAVAAELELAREAAGVGSDDEKKAKDSPGKAKGHD